MRSPNPPRIVLDALDSQGQRKVIALALKVVADLAANREWDALDKIELADLTLEEKLAFGSLLDSKQAAVIVDLRKMAKLDY